MKKIALWYSPVTSVSKRLELFIDDTVSQLHDKPILNVTLILGGFYLVAALPSVLVWSSLFLTAQFPWVLMGCAFVPWAFAVWVYAVFLDNAEYFLRPYLDRIVDWMDRHWSSS
jgi:hypothetical protein